MIIGVILKIHLVFLVFRSLHCKLQLRDLHPCRYVLREKAMISLTVTEFSRKLRSMLDLVEYKGEEIVLIRNKHKIARITPGSPHLTALEAMSDLYRTLPEDAAESWAPDGRSDKTLEAFKEKPYLIIDEETGVIFGKLSSSLLKAGRGADFRIQDIWVAAQAVEHNFPGLNLLVIQ